MTLTTRTLSRRVSLGAAALVIGVGAIAGCSGSSSSSSPGAGDLAPSSVSDTRAAPVARDAAAGSTARSGSAAAVPTALERKIARRAEVSLEVKDVMRSAADIRALADSMEGSVTSEALDGGPKAGTTATWGTMTISVPAANLDATLERLGKLGVVAHRSSSSNDVTATYTDTESRLATMRASVARVRALMSKATRIQDIVSLESELTRRQSDLESLEAQLAGLKGSLVQSPIQIRLSTDLPAPQPAADSGFVAGLKKGWGAFTASVVVVLTALGAVLPFAAVAALVLVPLALWVRRRRRPLSPTTPAAT